MISHAVILCGGLGTRMRKFGYSVPKFLLPIGEETIAYFCLKNLALYGVKSVHLLLSHDSETIFSQVTEIAAHFGIQITKTVEDIPRGTGGALLGAYRSLPEEFLLLHGDLLINTDLTEIASIFQVGEIDFAQVVHPSTHVLDSDLVEVDSQMNVRSYKIKPHLEFPQIKNFGNAGIYAFRKKTLTRYLELGKEKLDLDRELLPLLLSNGLAAKAVRNRQYIKDLGTPERYEKAKSNLRPFLNAKSPKPTVFLDRDGTINKLDGFIINRNQLSIIEGVPEAILKLNLAGFQVIVITNQPVIARGEVSREQLNSFHAFIEMELAKVGSVIDEFYYCPHHPESGYAGEIVELKIECLCRKPKTGLVEMACQDFPVDLEKSWMIGDSWRDVELANNIEIRSIKVGTGADLNFDFYSLPIAVDHILGLIED